MRGKRAFLSIVVLLAIAGTIFAEGGKEQEGAKTGEVKTIKFYLQQPPGVPDPNTGKVPVEWQNVADRWQKLRPNGKIEFVVQPWTSEQEQRTWHLTQLAAGTAPDAMQTQPNWIREDLGKGWWIGTDQFLDKPNPYNKQQPTWRQNFYPNLDVWRLADGKLYTVQFTQIQVVYFYNKDMFAKFGITTPQSWTEHMSNSKKIQAGGITPFAWNLSDLNQLTWTSGWFSNFILHDRIKDLDQTGDGLVNDWELAKAILDGKFKATDPGYKECLRVMKEMSPYWSKGSIGATRATSFREWVSGQAAMWPDTSTRLYSVMGDQLRKFDFGVAYYPPLLTDSSPFIKTNNVPPHNKAAGYGMVIGLTQLAEKRGTLDLVVDWLMYASTPENISAVSKELFLLPNIKGTEGPDVLKAIAPTLGYPVYPIQEEDVWLTIEYGTKYLQQWQNIYLGKTSLDDAAAAMQTNLMDSAKVVWETKEKATKK